MKWKYSGERFRQYLQRNNISYKQAADALGIDKNTVGKAVRGGNLNIDIILRICNIYDLSISDFFLCEDENGMCVDVSNTKNYDNSFIDNTLSCLEGEFKYKKCEISDVIDMVNNTKIMLENIAMNEQK